MILRYFNCIHKLQIKSPSQQTDAWDTSRVTTMNAMFASFNQQIGTFLTRSPRY